MMRTVTWGLLAGLWLGASGCVIGTWPTPEETVDPAPPTQPPLGPEQCDEVDNDNDGSVDEGCACETGAVRGCFLIVGVVCGPGVQMCEGGFWQDCAFIGPDTIPIKTPSVQIVNVDPPALVHSQTTSIEVEVEVTPVCEHMPVDRVEVVLAAGVPVMRVRAVAVDDGQNADAVAGDGRLTASLVNPFGPGVPPQNLALEAFAFIDGEQRRHTRVVELQP